jgi:hypothetical protein
MQTLLDFEPLFWLEAGKQKLIDERMGSMENSYA